MPTLVRIGRMRLVMFFRDHMPPHFHVSTPDGDAQIALADLSIINGQLRTSELEAVRRWARANIEFLEAEWERLNG